MKVMVLSGLKKVKGYDNKQFTKREMIEADVFMYDLFWFTHKGTRFGFEVNDIVSLRRKVLKQIDEEIKKLDKRRKK
jgi:hypothetical protein